MLPVHLVIRSVQPFNHSNYGNFALTATTGTGANAYGHQISVSAEGTALEYYGRNLQFFGRLIF